MGLGMKIIKGTFRAMERAAKDAERSRMRAEKERIRIERIQMQNSIRQQNIYRKERERERSKEDRENIRIEKQTKRNEILRERENTKEIKNAIKRMIADEEQAYVDRLDARKRLRIKFIERMKS